VPYLESSSSLLLVLLLDSSRIPRTRRKGMPKGKPIAKYGTG
jgi:hypothetical protein